MIRRAGNSAIAAGALLAAAGVALGALAAHGLRERLGAEALGWWRTAVEYQMWHALALIALGLGWRRGFAGPAILIGAGTAVFCGTLYALALGGPRWLGAVTPEGGAAMILGWLLLAWRGLRGA